MKIVIIAVGKLRDREVSAITQKYEKRLPGPVKLEWVEVGKSGSKDGDEAVRREEAENIRQKLPDRAGIIALSEGGKQMSSLEFAKKLGGIRDSGMDACFVIGGAEGLDKGLLEEADMVVSLSRMTFAHELTRAVLAEQIYRAFDILAGGPYHRQTP